MIQSFAYEFDTEEEMLTAADKLWDKHNITGEIEMIPLANGKWRLNVHSEKTVRDSTLEKITGKRVQAKSIAAVGKMKDTESDDE